MSDEELEQQINKAFKQAVAFHQMGQLEQAASIYRQLLRINPNQAEILHLLGLISYQIGVYSEAVVLIGRAVEVQPDVAKFHNHLGTALFALGKKQEAITQFKKALECPNPLADAYHNLGVALYEKGEWTEAIKIYEKAIKSHPDDGLLLNEVVKNMADACQWGGAYESYYVRLLEEATNAIKANKPCPLTPYHSLFLSDDPKLQQSLAQACAVQIESKIKPIKQQFNFTFEQGHKPSGVHHALRIGYVCADFRDHPTAHLLGHMLELHDKEQVEVFCYALGEPDDSAYRQRIKQASKHFTEVHNMPLHQVAQKIYDDKVDILIDLMGYISGAQPELFALRPAPVNIQYLAYPGTMGTGFMDYLVTDQVALADARQITETPIYMPDSYFVADKSFELPPANPRKTYGLPEEGVVFGAFNKPSKITAEMFAAWCTLLKDVQESVLWLYAPNDFTKENLRTAAEQNGVSASRLVFAERLDKKEHLARYAHIDIFLDSSPVTAHANAIDALLMQVPVVTIKGKTIISRASASILAAAGMHELICDDIDAYLSKALALAKDVNARDSMKKRLKQSLKDEALFNTKSYVKHFEMALHQAFQCWIEGEDPAPIHV